MAGERRVLALRRADIGGSPAYRDEADKALSDERREKLPRRVFLDPEERKWPMQSQRQAGYALSLAGMHHKAGRISDEEHAAVRRKALRLFPDLRPDDSEQARKDFEQARKCSGYGEATKGDVIEIGPRGGKIVGYRFQDGKRVAVYDNEAPQARTPSGVPTSLDSAEHKPGQRVTAVWPAEHAAKKPAGGQEHVDSQGRAWRFSGQEKPQGASEWQDVWHPVEPKLAPYHKLHHFPVENGALTDVPVYESHQRGKNWMATIADDPRSPGGLRREFADRARGAKYHYMVPEGLKPGDAVEFGADYISGGGKRSANRWHGVVHESGPGKLSLLKAKDAEDAFRLSKLHRESTPEDPAAKLTAQTAERAGGAPAGPEAGAKVVDLASRRALAEPPKPEAAGEPPKPPTPPDTPAAPAPPPPPSPAAKLGAQTAERAPEAKPEPPKLAPTANRVETRIYTDGGKIAKIESGELPKAAPSPVAKLEQQTAAAAPPNVASAAPESEFGGPYEGFTTAFLRETAGEARQGKSGVPNTGKWHPDAVDAEIKRREGIRQRTLARAAQPGSAAEQRADAVRRAAAGPSHFVATTTEPASASAAPPKPAVAPPRPEVSPGFARAQAQTGAGAPPRPPASAISQTLARQIAERRPALELGGGQTDLAGPPSRKTYVSAEIQRAADAVEKRIAAHEKLSAKTGEWSSREALNRYINEAKRGIVELRGLMRRAEQEGAHGGNLGTRLLTLQTNLRHAEQHLEDARFRTAKPASESLPLFAGEPRPNRVKPQGSQPDLFGGSGGSNPRQRSLF